jgi:hypothetical protein
MVPPLLFACTQFGLSVSQYFFDLVPQQYSHIVLYIYIDVKEINEQLITNVLPNGMDIFLTNRGKPGIKYDGFQYRLKKETSVSKLWRCVQKTCSARSAGIDCFRRPVRSLSRGTKSKKY